MHEALKRFATAAGAKGTPQTAWLTGLDGPSELLRVCVRACARQSGVAELSRSGMSNSQGEDSVLISCRAESRRLTGNSHYRQGPSRLLRNFFVGACSYRLRFLFFCRVCAVLLRGSQLAGLS
jgi:hypothetical protein